jgi:hypothetical protein
MSQSLAAEDGNYDVKSKRTHSPGLSGSPMSFS